MYFKNGILDFHDIPISAFPHADISFVKQASKRATGVKCKDNLLFTRRRKPLVAIKLNWRGLRSYSVRKLNV